MEIRGVVVAVAMALDSSVLLGSFSIEWVVAPELVEVDRV